MYFHWNNIYYPLVVSLHRFPPLWWKIKSSPCCISSLFTRRLTIAYKFTNLCPSSSICTKILSVMILAVSAELWSPKYSTSYTQVPKIGLLLTVPTGITLASRKRLVTLENYGPSTSLCSATSISRYVSSITSRVD